MGYKIENISYQIEGEGPQLLFLHGWGQSKESFNDLIWYLKKKYSCIAIDLPSFGKSKEPDKVLTIDDYGDIINEFISKNKFQIKAVIGHSFGGKIAFNYCYRYNKIPKLILCAPSIVKPIRGPLYLGKVALYKVCKKIPKLNEKIKDKISSKDYKNAQGINKEILINAVNTFYDDKLTQLENKTLLYWGEKDKTTPIYMAKKIFKQIPNCQLITIDGDHFAFKHNKYHCLNAIEDFLDE